MALPSKTTQGLFGVAFVLVIVFNFADRDVACRRSPTLPMILKIGRYIAVFDQAAPDFVSMCQG